jgi:hypothetical protein
VGCRRRITLLRLSNGSGLMLLLLLVTKALLIHNHDNDLKR